jgi:hypothetical protein
MSKTYAAPTLTAKGSLIERTEMMGGSIAGDSGSPPEDKLYASGSVGFHL